eukprot:926999-Alexandrium_andersonii.AAC.1
MSASLVGSEMCIRDSRHTRLRLPAREEARALWAAAAGLFGTHQEAGLLREGGELEELSLPSA